MQEIFSALEKTLRREKELSPKRRIVKPERQECWFSVTTDQCALRTAREEVMRLISHHAKNTLRCFIPLVKFLADSLGEHCEVVLHDATDVEHSIIAIANNHISGREVDGPLTDLAIRWINEKWHLKTDYLANYAGRTSNGKLTRSSTFFIRDDDGNLAGMLCLNFDVSALSRARDTLDALVRVAPLQEPESDAWSDGVENLTGSVEDLMHAALNDILAHSRVRPNRMTAKEKMDIVRKLKEKGIFLLKSSVSVVASRLESSESTIYRYLSLIEQHERKGN